MRNVGGSLASPEIIASVSADPFDGTPAVTDDDLVMYLAAGSGFFENTTIVVAKRSSTSEEFGTPEPVAELNTGVRQEPNWVSPDGCELYFSQDRGSGLELLVAQRPQL